MPFPQKRHGLAMEREMRVDFYHQLVDKCAACLLAAALSFFASSAFALDGSQVVTGGASRM